MILEVIYKSLREYDSKYNNFVEHSYFSVPT